MYRELICLLLLASAQRCHGSSLLEEQEVTLHHGIKNHDGGPPIVDPPRHTAGYMKLPKSHAVKLFYYYAQDRFKDSNSPLVFWTNGGPGGSAMAGAFGGFGPLAVTEDLKLQYSAYGWDQGHDVLFVDQPVGVGFSYSTDPRDRVRWEERVGEHMLAFFLEFMEQHPELRERELYLSGISYAGHYVPSIAAALLESNREGRNMHFNLAGVLLGNPSIHALWEYAYMPTFAFENTLISEDMRANILSHISDCTEKSRECNWKDTLDEEQYNRCVAAQDYCNHVIRYPILEANPGRYELDIRHLTSQHDSSHEGKKEEEESALQKYLNSKKVQKQLGVHKKWRAMNHTVYKNMEGDMMRDMTGDIVTLLNNGIRFMVFSGDKDLFVNWHGTKAMLAKMQWNLSPHWKNELRLWNVDMSDWYRGENAIVTVGACEALGPLTNCVIFNEGHTVGPRIAYIIMRNFVEQRYEFAVQDNDLHLLEPGVSSKEILAAA